MPRTTAQKVKAVRQSLRLTQRDLERKSGVSNSCISQFENGLHDITLEKFKAIAKALRCSPGSLI
jgi:transcriptional regulator with XRE-family HTH domain